jgi:hypothetical protein
MQMTATSARKATLKTGEVTLTFSSASPKEHKLREEKCKQSKILNALKAGKEALKLALTATKLHR